MTSGMGIENQNNIILELLTNFEIDSSMRASTGANDVHAWPSLTYDGQNGNLLVNVGLPPQPQPDGDVGPAGELAIVLLVPVRQGRLNVPDGGAEVGQADPGHIVPAHVHDVELLASLGPTPDDDVALLLIPRPVLVICAMEWLSST